MAEETSEALRYEKVGISFSGTATVRDQCGKIKTEAWTSVEEKR